MLEIEVAGGEFYDEDKNEFSTRKPVTLRLEHSLLSISKWESIWKIPFLHTTDSKGVDSKTLEQTLSYVKCMTINQNVPDYIYDHISDSDMVKIWDYVNSDCSATWFSETKGSRANQRIVTSELIYYWLVAYQIPWEAQKWHLSRLQTLVKICDVNSQTKKKMSKSEILSQNQRINEARRKANQTRG